jgi:hypothetical protein
MNERTKSGVLMTDQPKGPSPTTYQIKIDGRLDYGWADWFEGLTFTYERDGSTTLQGPLPDQAALHSILLKIRDMNLSLISVYRIEATA